MREIIIAILIKAAIVHGLTCDEVLELPSNKKLSFLELQSMQPEHIVQCLAHLGKEKLPPEEADFVWKSIIKFYDGIENIPDSTLMLLHWITIAVSPEDFRNITLNNIDVIQNFGLNYNLNEAQISAIAERVREGFAEKDPEDYTYYDLTALRQILCAFNRSEISRINPSAYKEAALLIGKLEQCSAEAMAGFAYLAVQNRAFGPPSKWKESTIKIIGKVAKFVSKDSTILADVR